MIFKNFFIITVLVSYFGNSQTDKGPYFATGIRIGDVSQNEAIIWTRLTKNKVRINDAPLPISLYVRPDTGKRHLRETRRDKDGVVYFPQGFDINTIEGAVPGAEGEVKINYRPKGSKKWNFTDWKTVLKKANYSKKFILTDLEPGITYEILVEGRSSYQDKVSSKINGMFKTPPNPEISKKIVFAASTCQGYPDQDHPDGYKIYPFWKALILIFLYMLEI